MISPVLYRLLLAEILNAKVAGVVLIIELVIRGILTVDG